MFSVLNSIPNNASSTQLIASSRISFMLVERDACCQTGLIKMAHFLSRLITSLLSLENFQDQIKICLQPINYVRLHIVVLGLAYVVCVIPELTSRIILNLLIVLDSIHSS
jgi:hypothetical protein